MALHAPLASTDSWPASIAFSRSCTPHPASCRSLTDEATKGFGLAWHEIDPSAQPEGDYSRIGTDRVELCLNFEGRGWIESGQDRVSLEPKTAAFFVLNGYSCACRAPLEHHRFLSVEYSIQFLQRTLAEQIHQAHPAIRLWLKGKPSPTAYKLSPLTHRHHEMLRNLLCPPVKGAAKSVWYEAKALELASEFFFPDTEGTGRERSRCLAAERVVRAKTILVENLSQPPTLKILGARVGCSPFYLSRTFTRETGMTISQWLRLARLEKAAELLKSGRWNVTEAALQVGYSSLSHFSVAFREQFGCCPGLYPLCTPSQPGPR